MSAGTINLLPIPGTGGIRDDRRIVGDVAWIEKTFHVRITAGYSATGNHLPSGDHPKGLAVDIVPGDGGSWDDVDRLAKYAADHPDVFRFVGYDGRFGTTAWPGHGRGQHLHLSWHGGGTAGDTKPLRTLTDSSGNASGPSLLESAAATLTGSNPLVKNNPINQAGAVVLDAAGEAAKAGAQAALQAVWDQIGEQATYALLWAALLSAGSALAVYGLIRALGVEGSVTELATKGAMLAVTKGAVK